ncbi:hypothetical protein P3T43_004021 [Paraburkholderia sp. GAS41]|jgi:hypothetical protein|uniref:hypothetical protein n=1 Tax=Paraburkholderia sp. GAS41 TaxID=3035134 RepID=UPI003D1A2B44
MNQPVEHLSGATARGSRTHAGAPFAKGSEITLHADKEYLLDEYLMLTFPASDPISPGFIT